jgi:hypothetical protein
MDKRAEIRNEKLAEDIKSFLIKYEMEDTRIYFNGKAYCFSSARKDKSQPYELIENIKGSKFFEYANDETVSMSFEGELYDLVNYEAFNSSWKRKLLDEFENIFKKHHCYYELGYSWSLSVYFD